VVVIGLRGSRGGREGRKEKQRKEPLSAGIDTSFLAV
jgi:hypothetical protein